jgi:hypothetical protein
VSDKVIEIKAKVAKHSAPDRLLDCVIVGGVAGGQVIKVKRDAGFFELRRPDYIKPLRDSGQLDPEVMHEKQIYEMHVIGLTDTGDPRTRLLGIGVVKGEALSAGFKQLIVAYVEKITAEHIQAGRIQTQ